MINNEVLWAVEIADFLARAGGSIEEAADWALFFVAFALAVSGVESEVLWALLVAFALTGGSVKNEVDWTGERAVALALVCVQSEVS